jgi:hypothetical protein
MTAGRFIANYLNVFCRIDARPPFYLGVKNATPGVPVMRLTKEELLIRVVVRRARRGATPFVWEINSENMVEPLFVSPDGFGSMEDAYRAGRARLPEFIPSPRSMAMTAEQQL